MTMTWPPSHDLKGGFFGQLAYVILGGSTDKLTWPVGLTSCHFSSDLKRGPRRGWRVNLTGATCQVLLVKFWPAQLVKFYLSSSDRRNLSSFTCQVALVPKAQVYHPAVTRGVCSIKIGLKIGLICGIGLSKTPIPQMRPIFMRPIF